MALRVYLALGAAIIIAVLVIFAAVVLFQQLAVTADPSEPHARDAAEDDGGIREYDRAPTATPPGPLR